MSRNFYKQLKMMWIIPKKIVILILLVTNVIIENKETIIVANGGLKIQKEFDKVMNHMKEILKIQKIHKETRAQITRKQRNKNAHIKEGNKSKGILNLGWWNDKRGQKQKAVNVKERLTIVLDKLKIDMMGISESNAEDIDSKHDLSIKGYTVVHDKLMKEYGRARSSVYIKQNIKHRIRSDLMSDEHAEVWVELIGGGRNNNILFCQYYREQKLIRKGVDTSGSDRSHNQRVRLERWIAKTRDIIATERKPILLGGDINAELGGNGRKQDALGKIINNELLIETGLEMIIKEFTHMEVRNGVECAKRCIDHVYTNQVGLVKNIEVKNQSGSHHKLLKVEVNKKIQPTGVRQHRARVRKQYSKTALLNELDRCNWELPENDSNNPKDRILKLEEVVNKLNINMKTALEKIAPMKVLNKRVTREPWRCDEEVLRAYEKESKLWTEWKKDVGNKEKKVGWERMKKTRENLIEEKKSMHIRKETDQCLSNEGKSLWKAVKSTLNWNSGGPPLELRDKNGVVEDKLSRVCRIYHDNLEEKINNIIKELEPWTESKEEEEIMIKRSLGKAQKEFKFQQTSEECVKKIISKLPRKTSTGDDEVSYVDLIDGGYYTARVITWIINNIVATSHWPTMWSNSLVKPLYKNSGDLWEAASYRPVAITSAVGRIVERVLNQQLTEWLIEEGLIIEDCHGFIPGRGTVTAVVDIVTHLQEDLEDNQVPILLGVDISSAFDCIIRKKLLSQLRYMGMGEEGLTLLESYFWQRTQQVEIGQERGRKRPAPVGVLQGSGLSPILFLIYFLRGCLATKRCTKCQNQQQENQEERGRQCQECGTNIAYADDLNVINKERSFDRVIIEEKIASQGEVINMVLRKLSLKMNKVKTQFLAIMNRQRRCPPRNEYVRRVENKADLNVIIDGVEVKETEGLKTLGVTFDRTLSFMNYWESMKKPMMMRINAISRIGGRLTLLQRKSLSNGIALSKLAYCLEATSTGSRTSLLIGRKILNRLVRSTMRMWNYEDTRVCYTALGWLNIEQLTIFRTTCLAKKMLIKNDPIRIVEKFATRSLDGWEMKPSTKSRTTVGSRSFVNRVKRIFEEIPIEILNLDLTSKQNKMKLEDEVKKLNIDWILWGKKDHEKENANDNDSENDEDDSNGSTANQYDTSTAWRNTVGTINIGNQITIENDQLGSGGQNWSTEELITISIINENLNGENSDETQLVGCCNIKDEETVGDSPGVETCGDQATVTGRDRDRNVGVTCGGRNMTGLDGDSCGVVTRGYQTTGKGLGKESCGGVTYCDQNMIRPDGDSRGVVTYDDQTPVTGLGGDRCEVVTRGYQTTMTGLGLDGDSRGVLTYNDQTPVTGLGGDRREVVTRGYQTTVTGLGKDSYGGVTYCDQNMIGPDWDSHGVGTYDDQTIVTGLGEDKRGGGDLW